MQTTTLSDQHKRKPAFSISEAAEALTVSTRTITRMIENGKIKSVKVSDRRRVITQAEIDRILSGAAA